MAVVLTDHPAQSLSFRGGGHGRPERQTDSPEVVGRNIFCFLSSEGRVNRVWVAPDKKRPLFQPAASPVDRPNPSSRPGMAGALTTGELMLEDREKLGP